jgi:hypothetical protein
MWMDCVAVGSTRNGSDKQMIRQSAICE